MLRLNAVFNETEWILTCVLAVISQTACFFANAMVIDGAVEIIAVKVMDFPIFAKAASRRNPPGKKGVRYSPAMATT